MRREFDKAIGNVMRWAERPEWKELHEEVFDSHLPNACRQAGIEIASLAERLDRVMFDILIGIALEDLVSRRFEPGGRNVIDDYLERRGWREAPAGRQYLRALRDSRLSLYEVLDVAPGRSVDIRDLLREGKRVRVHEHLGSQSMVRWDQIAARVLTVEGRRIFSGGLLHLPAPVAHDVRDLFQRALARARRRLAGWPAEALPPGEMRDLLLESFAPTFTLLWVCALVGAERQPLALANTDGEPLEFWEARFAIEPGQTAAIDRRLDGASGWEREPGEPRWICFELRQPAAKAGRRAASGPNTVRATLERTDDTLLLTTNSRERMELARARIEELLKDLVGAPLTAVQSVERLLAERATDGAPRPFETADAASRAELEALEHAARDQHYRGTLRERIPALGNRTPRQALRSKAGRHQLIGWLKELENHELRFARDEGRRPYDFGWMWTELGLQREP